MLDFGKSLITMNPDEQKKVLGNATNGQRRAALGMGIGFKNQHQPQQQRQQKRDAYHDLDRLNFTVEKENEAHDFFGKGLADWQKNVTGREPSNDAIHLKKQFDDYESSILSTVPKGGKRHTALVDSLSRIKEGFLKQGHQFALDKLNERSRNVLDKGLQRIAKGALGAKDENGVQAHDDAAFDLINKYVLSEAKFDGKDADAMYDKYLGYAGVNVEKARASENEDVPGAKPGFKMEDAEMYAEKDTGTVGDAGGEQKAEPKKEPNMKTEEDVEKGDGHNRSVPDKDAEPKREKGKVQTFDRFKPGEMASSEDVKERLKKREVYREKPYDNDGARNCTIGYGHLLHRGACTQEDYDEYKDGWSKEKAQEMFESDVKTPRRLSKNMSKWICRRESMMP
ncbi:hypothetical protein [Desulfovibrio sp. Huiquan2017]|uniref:hypothetical protein n=1 Tax=Desulfovibrio sp. Huiquan2017 TaxID=2816861 RepID=UPI001A91E78D|nr:hypothetical protein [Desulfovibrio sp. Huiquan2017]